jgi:thiamine pyrophosphokinase
VADGDVPSRPGLDHGWPGWDLDTSLIVAADGGWDKAERLGLEPNVLVGDGDSLAPETAARASATAGVTVEPARTDKDESDAELAILAALARGAVAVTVLGALGGRRFDHALANVGLLALAPAEVSVQLLDATTRVRLLAAPDAAGRPVTMPLPGETGDLVSLLPLGVPAEGVTTVGLRFPLSNETLRPGPARGLSNVRLSPGAAVTLRRGSLLVVETRVDKVPAGPGRSEKSS